MTVVFCSDGNAMVVVVVIFLLLNFWKNAQEALLLCRKMVLSGCDVNDREGRKKRSKRAQDKMHNGTAIIFF